MNKIQKSKMFQKVIWYPYEYVYTEQIQKKNTISPWKNKIEKNSTKINNSWKINSIERGGGSADITSAAQEMPQETVFQKVK